MVPSRIALSSAASRTSSAVTSAGAAHLHPTTPPHLNLTPLPLCLFNDIRISAPEEAVAALNAHTATALSAHTTTALSAYIRIYPHVFLSEIRLVTMCL